VRSDGQLTLQLEPADFLGDVDVLNDLSLAALVVQVGNHLDAVFWSSRGADHLRLKEESVFEHVKVIEKGDERSDLVGLKAKWKFSQLMSKVLTGARFESLVLLNEPSDELFTLTNQVSRVSFNLALTVVARKKIKPADLKMESEEEDQVWVSGVMTLSIACIAIQLVECRIVCSGGVKCVGHVLDVDQHGISENGSRVSSGKRSLMWGRGEHGTLDRWRASGNESLQEVVEGSARGQSRTQGCARRSHDRARYGHSARRVDRRWWGFWHGDARVEEKKRRMKCRDVDASL
jgi:hypothetical protein